MGGPLQATNRQVKLLTISLLAAPLALSACSSGSSGRSSAGGGAALAKAPAGLCEQLNAVFSDGPDPDADPVGYALSQILPLQGVHTSDAAVSATVDRLIAADQDLVKSNGDDTSATAAVKKADDTLNQACPGVAP
jgi:hypothetical protein